MGIEYKILFSPPTKVEIDHAIRQLPFFHDFDEEYQLYNLLQHPDRSQFGMPDAWVAIEKDGLYYCDNCTNAVGIKEAIIDLAKRFDPLATIDEL